MNPNESIIEIRHAVTRDLADFRLMAEHSPVQAWTALPDGRLDYVSPRVEEFTGRPASEMLEHGWKDILHPADVPVAAQRWSHSVQTGEPYAAEFRLRRGSDGLYFWFQSRAEPVQDTTGAVVRWVGANTEVNALKRAAETADARQELAKRERDRLMRAFRYAPAVVCLYSGPQFEITMANPLWEQFTGRKDAVGKPVRQAFPELDAQGLFSILDNVFATGELFRATEMAIRFDRGGTGQLEDTYWNLVVQPLSEPGEPVTDILSHAVEVTEMVRAREQVAMLQRDLDAARQQHTAGRREA
jgi:PAS domain S-box-containing protein